MKSSAKKDYLNRHILIGAGVGIVFGFMLNAGMFSPDKTHTVLYVLGIVKGVFINLLKMIVVPLVFTSIALGIANLRKHSAMGIVWKSTLGYFIGTSALAVLLGLALVNIFQPGADTKIDIFEKDMSAYTSPDITTPEYFSKFVNERFFISPVKAMAEGEILGTIVFAIFIGIAIVKAKEKAKGIHNLLQEFFDLIMMIVGWIMRLAPWGILALLAILFAGQDIRLLKSLAKFIGVVLLGTFLHGAVTLPLLLKWFGEFSPWIFFRGMKDALITAFSTSSSSATLPISLRCVDEVLNVDKDIAGFVMPLGTTINMDGTALYEAIAALFVANLIGLDLNIVSQLMIFLVAILASMGAPGIPSAGMFTMILVLQYVGLPIEAIGILIPIDRFLDTFRTMVNAEGDAIGSVIVNRYCHKQTGAEKVFYCKHCFL